MLKMLKAPFDAKSIHWRVGSTDKKKQERETGNKNAKATCGIPLAYLDARDVMERLDDACGAENWQCKYPYEGCCELSIRIDGEWITKTNGSDETKIDGKKGQYSGAFKRAAVMFGVGQYLYDVPNKWFPVNNWGQFDKSTMQELTSKLTDWQTQYFAKKG